MSFLSSLESLTLKLERAFADLRRGFIVALDESYFCLAAEYLSEQYFNKLTTVLEGNLWLTVANYQEEQLRMHTKVLDITSMNYQQLMNFVAGSFETVESKEPAGHTYHTSLQLLKAAQLLPISIVFRAKDYENFKKEYDIINITHIELQSYLRHINTDLVQVCEARLVLKDAADAKIIAFRASNGSSEHYAIIIGEPNTEQCVNVRLHSSCYTGDLLDSLKCDCGSQLKSAIKYMAAAGGGVIIYLMQEGRGIGLINKLRAYALQDQGWDTVEANHRLGFAADERSWQPAISILRQLGIKQLELLSNNPAKTQALQAAGFIVEKVVPVIGPRDEFNAKYLAIKKHKLGHNIADPL